MEITLKQSPFIWIVDDDNDDQFFIEVAFKEILPSVKIKQLYDGVDLLMHLNQASILPRLLLLDLNMPFKSGLEALKELREDPSFQDLPVVVLTTSDAFEQKQRSLQLGANGFLTKPASQDELVKLLRKLTTEWNLAEG